MEQLKYGFLPAQVLLDINDLGNWKNRSQAVEQVQQALSSMADKSQLVHHLPQLVDFMTQLLRDHNFKVATAGLNMLTDVAGSAGSAMQLHIRTLAVVLLQRLSDAKPAVVVAAGRACAGLLTATGDGSLVQQLLLAYQQQRQQQSDSLQSASDAALAAGRDCSGLLEVVQLALLKLAPSKLGSMQPLVQFLHSCSRGNSNCRLQALALEGLALATDALGAQLPPLLRQVERQPVRPHSVGVAEGEPGGDLGPLPDPEASLRQAISKCQQSNTAARKELDWQGQLEALMDARRLAAHHVEVLRTAAHELVLAALPAVEELRSTTARVALQLFQELPLVLGRSLEREVDELVPVLLKKAGELSTAGRDNFLAAEADKALSALCSAVGEGRATSALIAAGIGHKSPHVRCRAAAHLDEIAAGGAGLEGLVRSNWTILDKLFKAAAAFLQEGSLDSRTYGKRLLWAVKVALRGSRVDLERLLAGVAPEAQQRRVVEVLEALTAPPPAPTSRAVTASGESRTGSRGAVTPTTPTSVTSMFGPPGPMSPELQEAVDAVGLHLASKDWRDRTDALRALAALLPALPEVPDAPLEGLLHGVIARLGDGNAKVNIKALEVLSEVLLVVRDRTQLVLGSLVAALAANMGSSSEHIRNSAAATMDTLLTVADPAALAQSLAHALMNSSSSNRSKPAMAEKLACMVSQVYRHNPLVVVKQVLPAAFALALEARGDVKPAAAQLLGTLAHLMGPAAVIGQAATVSGAVEVKFFEIINVMNAELQCRQYADHFLQIAIVSPGTLYIK
eukprot:gene4304-4556_t